jgi:hypothetical protein
MGNQEILEQLEKKATKDLKEVKVNKYSACFVG